MTPQRNSRFFVQTAVTTAMIRSSSRNSTRPEQILFVPASDCREPDQADVFRKDTTEPTETDINLNFRPLRPYFEEEAATSTTSAIHQRKARVKPEFEAPLPEFSHQYPNLATRSTEIWYQNRHTESEQMRNVLSAVRK